MKRFESPTSRVFSCIAAVVMTMITFALFVILPATIEFGREDIRTANVVVHPAANHGAFTPDS